LKERAAVIAAERCLKLEWKTLQDANLVPCDLRLNIPLRAAIQKVTGESIDLPSGAGYDGVMLSRVCPVAMMFARCRDGLSHHPEEFVDPADLTVALHATAEFLDGLSIEFGNAQ
jgi:allantoate deiminase